MKRERKKENKEKVEELENGRRISGGKKKMIEMKRGWKESLVRRMLTCNTRLFSTLSASLQPTNKVATSAYTTRFHKTAPRFP